MHYCATRDRSTVVNCLRETDDERPHPVECWSREPKSRWTTGRAGWSDQPCRKRHSHRAKPATRSVPCPLRRECQTKPEVDPTRWNDAGIAVNTPLVSWDTSILLQARAANICGMQDVDSVLLLRTSSSWHFHQAFIVFFDSTTADYSLNEDHHCI